jgi:hypothetical protein
MGWMKELDIRIRNGGDDAVDAAVELAGLVKERRAYEEVRNSTEDITDIVVILRSVGFASISPYAGETASLLHYCVTHAADEIEQLRLRCDGLAADNDSMRAAIETAGFIYRNTDSGPNLVQPGFTK